MIENDIITLEDDSNYGILLDTKLDDNNYFLVVELDDDEQPKNNFKVLKEIIEENDSYVIEETDALVLNKLLDMYRKKLN